MTWGGLGARWQKELRLRYLGDPQLCQQRVGVARVQVGIMERQRVLAGVGHAHLFRQYKGYSINTLFDGTTYIAEISVESTRTETADTGDVWVPQGMVIEPAGDEAPAGWGFPVIAEEGRSPYDPGPFVEAWTPSGPLSQVLLTQAANAGYPKQRSIELYYDKFDKPPGVIRLPRLNRGWQGYRARFRNPGSLGRAILAEINNRRDVEEPLSPAFFGFADLAAYLRRLIRKFGGSEPSYPAGSRTLFRRMEKEGNCTTSTPGNASGALEVVAFDSGDPIGSIVDDLEAAIPALTDSSIPAPASLSIVGNNVAFLNHADQWVRCGNLDWKSPHPEIPRLSWCGPQGRSIPPYELAFGFRSGTTIYGAQSYLDELETDFQDKKIKVFDRFVYARGRILGEMPDNGYVLGAAIQRIVDDESFIYRLIVISWHREDQYCPDGGDPSGYVINFDTTSDVRVYYADLPTRGGLACHPAAVIGGLYDDEDNPYGWNLAGQHRLWPFGTTQFGPGVDTADPGDDAYYADGSQEKCSPKTYWQPWFFNGSGTKAVCLRACIRPAFGGLQAGISNVAQALKIEVGEATGAASSTIGLEWETTNASLQAGGEFGPVYIAWDFLNDDPQTVSISGNEEGMLGYAMHSNGQLVAEMDWFHDTENFVTGVTETTLWYIDARDNTYIRAVQIVKQYLTQVGNNNVTHVDATIVVAGEVKLAFSFDVDYAEPFFIPYSSFNPYRDIFALTRDQFVPFDYPNPTLLVAMCRYGADFAAGVWMGANPGTFTRIIPTPLRFGDWRTQGWAHASSVEIEPYLGESPSWINFAGVV